MHKLLFLMAFIVGIVTSLDAFGQTICVNRTDMLDRLAAEFEEHLAEVRQYDEGLAEILKSSTKGTWTMILTQPYGMSCVIATGGGLPATDLGPFKTSEFTL